MRKITFLIPLFLVVFLQQACITHYVMDDYPKYLENNKNTLKLPKLDYSLSFAMDPATSAHTKQVQAFTTGIANKWIIEFGRMLRATMQSSDVLQAFRSVTENDPKADINVDIVVINYDFTEHRAVVMMEVSVSKAGQTKVFTKKYSAQGRSQGGKMFFAGAFGMKNAIQQSSKSAMDEILVSLVNDIKKEIHVPNT